MMSRRLQLNRTSHEYWIIHVIFDRSHMTVRNVQVRFYSKNLLSAYIIWMVSVLLVIVDALLAVDLLSLTQCQYD